MSTKHTPGPWKSELNEKYATADILGKHGDSMRCRASDGHGSIVIVECGEYGHEGIYAPMLEEQLANARLIAAAPELLEALQNLLAVQPNFMANSAEIADARAAIAKAVQA